MVVRFGILLVSALAAMIFSTAHGGEPRLVKLEAPQGLVSVIVARVLQPLKSGDGYLVEVQQIAADGTRRTVYQGPIKGNKIYFKGHSRAAIVNGQLVRVNVITGVYGDATAPAECVPLKVQCVLPTKARLSANAQSANCDLGLGRTYTLRVGSQGEFRLSCDTRAAADGELIARR